MSFPEAFEKSALFEPDETLIASTRRRKYVYGVFIGSKWGVTTNRAEALAAIRNGGEVRRMLYSYWREGSAWDAPTFSACSDLLDTRDYLHGV